jgi:hypothetical protein
VKETRRKEKNRKEKNRGKKEREEQIREEQRKEGKRKGKIVCVFLGYRRYLGRHKRGYPQTIVTY